MSALTHLDDHGAARMVDVGGKAETAREAVASGRISMTAEAARAIRDGAVAKGDVLAVARVAGIMAAKKTADLIPLCHPLPLSRVTLDLAPDDSGVTVTAMCPGFVRTEFHQRGEMDVSTVPGWMWLRADSIVRETLKDHERGRAVSIPSLRYKTLAFLARYAPTAVVARAAKRGR